MQWTKEKPSAPGFYWFKGNLELSEQITIVEVFYHYHIRSQIFVRFFGCECGMDVSGIDGEWCGPLKLPEDQSNGRKIAEDQMIQLYREQTQNSDQAENSDPDRVGHLNGSETVGCTHGY